MSSRPRTAANPSSPPIAPLVENLFGLERPALEALCRQWGEPAYRARQLFEWLYRKRVRSASSMSSLSLPLRRTLSERGVILWPEVASRQESQDGTIKYLLALRDGLTVECVLIPEPKRRTLCLSTQVGCPLRCAFCLTGLAGFSRNLTPGEILGQVAVVWEDAPPLDRPWNVVFMGMGEPLLNYESTVSALRILTDEDGFGIPPRRITLSTVGVVPGIERLMQEPVRPNLAVSVHAADPALRRRLVPIEARYPLTEVLAVARRYSPPQGGRVTLEYVLIKGINDSPAAARRLVRLTGGLPAKINLIPLNPAPEIAFEAPTPEAVEAFAGILADARITVSVRRPRGQDVLAACGQLHVTRASLPGTRQAS